MATQAFEEFRKKQKESSATSGSSSNIPKGKTTSAFEEFQKSRGVKPTSPAPQAPTPQQPAKPEPVTFSGKAGGYLDSVRTPTDDMTFGSRTSTQVLPTKEQADQVSAITTPVVQKGQAIAAKAKEMRKSESAGTRVTGALADSAIETGKSLVQKLEATAPKRDASGNFRTSGLAMLDFGLNFATLGLTDFVPDAAPEIAGALAETGAKLTKAVPGASRFVDEKKTGQAVQSGVRQGLDFLFGKILYEGVGGLAADTYEKAFGELSPEDRDSIKSIATIGTMVAAFKTAGRVAEVRGKRAADIRSANDLVAPMAESLGMNVKYDNVGNAIIPNVEVIAKAHKTALQKAASDGGQFVYAKMDAFDTARQMLVDYKTQGAAGFAQKWQSVFESGSRLADEVSSRVALKGQEAELTSDAAKVNAILTEPATPKTLKLTKELSQEAQFAFEQELVDMNATNDPKLGKQVQGDGYTFERTSVPFDDRPAYYDALTNKITLNEDGIRKTLEGVWKGEVLKVGEGKTTTVFRKNPNETFEQLKTRYEKTLVEHEMAHAKTITPEDVARLRAAVGNETQLNKIRKELEDRANEYSFRKPSDLDAKTESAVDYTIERVQKGLNLKENLDALKFPKSERETSYSRWKKIVSKNQDYLRADFDQFEAGLKKSPAYKNKSVKALFEDALDRQGDGASIRSTVDSFDRLLEEFQSRYKTERSLIDEYKQARAAQQKLLPDVKRNPAVERAVKREMKAEMALQKQEGKTRKLEVRLLRERITRRLEKEVLREKAAAAELRLRSKITDKQGAQQDLVDFMRENGVPKEVQGKFLTRLKNASKDADVKGIIDEIRTEYNKYERRERRATIKELLQSTKVKRDPSGKNTGKLTASVQKKLDFVRKISKVNRNALNQKIIELVDTARLNMQKEGNASLELPDNIANEIELLELGGLKEQSLTQLKRTEAVIRELIETGKTDRKISVDLRREKIRRFVASSLERLTGSPKRALATQRAVKNMEQDRWTRRYYNSSAVFEDLTRELGGVFENAGKETAKGVNRSIGAFSDEVDSMRNKLQSVYGKTWREQMTAMTNDQKDFGKMVNKNGETVDVRATRGYAMDLYMRLQEGGSREFILEKDGLAYTDAMVDNILGLLTGEDKTLADWIVKEGYTKWYKQIAPVYERRTGIPLGNVENFAGTRRFEKGISAGDDVALGFVEDMIDSSTSYRLSSTPQFVKSRVARNGNIRISNNPIMDYLTYSKRASHYIEVGDQIQEWRSLMADEAVRNGIDDKYGKSFREALQFHVDNITRGGFEMKGRDSSLSKIADELSGNVSSALLFNPRVWAGQLSSVAGFKSEMSLLPGKQSDFWRGIKNTKNNKADILKYSPAVRTRLAATPFELLQNFDGNKGRIKKALRWIKEKQAIPLEKMDSFTTMRAASGVFEAQKNYYVSQGFDLEKAKSLAGADVDSIVTRTQSTRQYIGKTQLEAGSLRYLVQLRQQPIKIARANFEAGKLLRQGRITGKQFAQFFLWNNVVQGAAYVALRSVPSYMMLVGAKAAYDILGKEAAADEKEKDLKRASDPKQIATSMGLNMISNVIGLPVIGDVANTIVQNAAHGTNFEFRPTLFDTLADDFVAAGKQWGDGDIDESAILGIRAISRGAGIGDPGDLIKWVLGVRSQANKERKALERKTPDAKRAAAEKREATAKEKRAKDLAKRKKAAGIK